MRCAVVVVGDLGRSPRMQYHAHALAANEIAVDLIGYEGAPLPRQITEERRIAVHRLTEPRLRLRAGASITLYALFAIVDGIRSSYRLWRALSKIPRPDLILVQNPPSMPTLAVAWAMARIRKARLVVDWHNLGYTLLTLRLGRRHPAVRLARWLERLFGGLADAHLCVSRGFAKFLRDRFGVKAANVLYDRPAAVFVPIDRTERERVRQALFTRLGVRGAGPVGFIVSPTSWTADEDFDVVIDAVRYVEDRIRGWEAGESGRRFADLVMLVTGDGARRAEFERRFAGLPARRVQLRTRWLEPEDYPRIVGAADLGLCLHRSSSGVDIPMKVADLFGVGVPVCALDYGACLAERVRHGDNGLLFSTPRQLADLLFDLFEGYPDEPSLLTRLRTGARRSARPTWEEGWTKEARPVLLNG
ncbi:MAG TPA: glycosyltransferase [Vicinamibacterales bacterium]|jgi:beta-1,4-mannosyltransferase|nr:glycosyltransferase [Vicinamibacterales bacterium]